MAVQPFVRAAAYMNIDHLGEGNGKVSSPRSIPACEEQLIGAKLERSGGLVAALLSEHHRVPITVFLHLHRVANTRSCHIREIPDTPRGLREARFGEDRQCATPPSVGCVRHDPGAVSAGDDCPFMWSCTVQM
jgi:hypothetical protein